MTDALRVRFGARHVELSKSVDPPFAAKGIE